MLIAVYELEKAAKTTEETVITFSHFLPRSDLLALTTSKPPALIHVMGSSKIDEQLRELASDIHVFGHSHENVDTVIDVSFKFHVAMPLFFPNTTSSTLTMP